MFFFLFVCLFESETLSFFNWHYFKGLMVPNVFCPFSNGTKVFFKKTVSYTCTPKYRGIILYGATA